MTTPPYYNQFPGYSSPSNPRSASFSLPSTVSFPPYTIANLPPLPGTYSTASQNSNTNAPPYQIFPVSPSSTPVATSAASYSRSFSPQMQAPYATGNSVTNLQTMYPGPYSGQHPVTQPAPIIEYPNVINDPTQYPFLNTPVSIPAEYSRTNTTFRNTRNWKWPRPQNWVDGQDGHIIGKGRDGVVWRVQLQ